MALPRDREWVFSIATVQSHPLQNIERNEIIPNTSKTSVRSMNEVPILHARTIPLMITIRERAYAGDIHTRNSAALREMILCLKRTG